MKKTILLASLAFSINAFAQIPTNGLLGYWPFNGNANDLSGNSYDGTVNGATLTTDRFGNANAAYSFNGISDYISTANINLHDTATISVWVNPFLDAAGNNSWGYSASLVDQNQDANGNSSYGLYYNNTADHGLYAATGWSGNSTTEMLSHVNLSLNNWHHCVLTLNNGTGKLYMDGVLIITQSGLASTSQTSNVLLFGKAPWASNGNVFNGKLDDIRIYDRPLNSSDVTALYSESICYQTITVTDTLIINANILGFNPVKFQNSIKIFPNPTNNQITIDFGSNFSTMNGHTLKITNTLSQIVYTTPINVQKTTVNLSTWTGNGIYFVHLVDASSNTIDIKKIVLQ